MNTFRAGTFRAWAFRPQTLAGVPFRQSRYYGGRGGREDDEELGRLMARWAEFEARREREGVEARSNEGVQAFVDELAARGGPEAELAEDDDLLMLLLMLLLDE